MSYNTHQRFRNKIFFSTVHIIKWMLLSLALGISQKRWKVMNFYNHFLWYCNITAQLPLHLFIYHSSCTYCLTDKKDHMFYPMFNKFQHRDFFHSVPGIVCIDVILQYFTLYTFYRVHWIPWHMSVSFITFSFLQKSWFMRNNENKHRCIFVQMGMYLI